MIFPFLWCLWVTKPKNLSLHLRWVKWWFNPTEARLWLHCTRVKMGSEMIDQIGDAFKLPVNNHTTFWSNVKQRNCNFTFPTYKHIKWYATSNPLFVMKLEISQSQFPICYWQTSTLVSPQCDYWFCQRTKPLSTSSFLRECEPVSDLRKQDNLGLLPCKS